MRRTLRPISRTSVPTARQLGELIARGSGKRRTVAWAIAAAIAYALFSGSNATASEPAIVVDAKKAAEAIAKTLTNSGYKADFSIESLQQVERFFLENSERGKAKAGGPLSQQLGARLFAIGSYVGEVIRRECKGQWFGNDSDPRAEINIAVDFPNSVRMWPVQRVMRRFTNGPEDNIYHYGVAAVEYCKRPARKPAQ